MTLPMRPPAVRLTPEEVSIGDWWAPCCIHDLQQIVTGEELDEARQGLPFAGGWHHLADAVAALLDPRIYVLCPEALADEIAYAKAVFPAAFTL